MGRTRDNDLNDCLWDYKDFALCLDDLSYWVMLPDTRSSWRDYRIHSCLQKASRKANLIVEHKKRWMELLGITEQDLSNFGYDYATKNFMEFKQTVPIEDDAIDVSILLSYIHTKCIRGETNLFDYAQPMLSFCSNGGTLLYQNISEVMNGFFQFQAPKQHLMDYRHYKIEINLTVPRSQPAQFIKEAGQEYQNLTGPYIRHFGTDSTLFYWEYLDLKLDLKKVPPELATSVTQSKT